MAYKQKLKRYISNAKAVSLFCLGYLLIRAAKIAISVMFFGVSITTITCIPPAILIFDSLAIILFTIAYTIEQLTVNHT